MLPSPRFAAAFVSLALVACSSTGDVSPPADPDATRDGSAPGTPTAGADASVADSAPPSPPVTPTQDAAPPIADATPPPPPDAGPVTTDAASPPTCVGASKICLAIRVPATVDARKVVKLYVGFSRSKGGIPEIGKGTTVQPITVTPGQVLPLTIDNKGLSGAFFLNVGLYLQGGGSASPKPGVDYSAWTSAAVALSTAPTPIAEELTLQLAQ